MTHAVLRGRQPGRGVVDSVESQSLSERSFAAVLCEHRESWIAGKRPPLVLLLQPARVLICRLAAWLSVLPLSRCRSIGRRAPDIS